MLLKFCCRNKDNKKGRVPSEELDLNLYIIQKYLADTNKRKRVCEGEKYLALLRAFYGNLYIYKITTPQVKTDD